MRFRNREDAGRRLAERVVAARLDAPLVLALPRGGVPVAAPVAAALGVPLTVFVARKVGAPGRPELGIAAIAEGSDEVVLTRAVGDLGIGSRQLRSLVAVERAELERRVERYRASEPLPALGARDVVLVDDGLATGVTAEAALVALRGLGARRLVLAAPVGAPDTVRRLAGIADSVVVLASPARFDAVGSWYDDFTQTTDDEVLALLADPTTRGP